MAQRVFAKLEPINNPGEVLANRCQSRPEVFVMRNDFVTLGRNKTTMIGLDILSRQLCRVRASSNNRKLLLKLMKPVHSLHVNQSKVQTRDPVVLKDGDIISLVGEDYAYRVHYPVQEEPALVTDEEAPSQQSAAATAAPQQPQQESEVAEEITCPICLDILVQSTALACGHVFCRVCLDGGGNAIHSAPNALHHSGVVRDCPVCRQRGRGAIALKQMDNLVWKLIKQGGYFDREDVETYLERDGRQLTDEEVSW
jgi:hypothetical protein